MQKLSGARIIVELLERQGVHTVAGIPGGGNLALYDALSRSEKLHHVLARHEQGAGFIAQGMARVTGRPQVCIATSGPGVTNILTAIADAKLDSIPLVCIAGQVPRSLIGTSAFQEVDTYRLSLPITKKSFKASAASELLQLIPEAFRIAASGRRGPVLIDVPKDVQTETFDVAQWPAPGKADPSPAIPAEDVLATVEAINAAKRPILLLGGGVIHAEAGRFAVLLAEKASIPVASSLMGLGAVPSDHPLCLGLIGMHAAVHTNMALEECDLLISAGVRFDDRATGKLEEFCPRATVVHVDIDPGEIGRLKAADIGITGDVGEVLEKILPMVKHSSRENWLAFIEGLKKAHPMPLPPDGSLGAPYGLIRETARLLGDEAVVVTDVGQHQMWTAQSYPFRRSRQWLTSGGLGTMGFGVPAAIGAALCSPDRPVVCFSGDGSLMMNIQELATAVQEGVNVKIVVFDNRCLGLVRQQQDLFFDRRRFACNFDSPADFTRIAEGFGMPAFDLDASEDPLGTLARALKTKGPCLIRARIGRDEKVYPMVPPGQANRCMLSGENTCDRKELPEHGSS
ncbi:MAG: acetolactate synthase large subunit [Desulfobacteraceae bacterium]|nr:acetolactate synthase large subunit [Desulfobacteraceae bacterium]